MSINMHIYKPGHAILMTRGGWIQNLGPLLLHYWAGHPCWPSKRLDYNPRIPFAIKMHLRHSPMFFFSVCIALVKVPLYSDSSRALCWTIYRVFQTDKLVCMQNTHTGITWGAAGPQSRTGKFKLVQPHLDEQTGLYRNRHKKGHNSILADEQKAQSIQGNTCQWPVPSNCSSAVRKGI